jgi:phage gp46-like protein
MTDIALIFDPDTMDFDAALDGADLKSETGLATAIYMSWFTDAPAKPGDVIPDGTNDGRGWWGDYNARVDGDRIGSRLWLLKRSKRTAEVIRLAADYAREGLQWMIADGVAAAVDVSAGAQSTAGILLTAVITKPGGNNSEFSYVWQGLNG